MQLKVYNTANELYLEIADRIVDRISKKLKSQDQFTWLLSGGNTPRQLYLLLASKKFSDKIDWSRLHIFFGDERVVPFDDERNNGRMAWKTLLSHVPVPENQVHFMETRINPVDSAAKYEKLLHEYFDEKETTFDLALLGMGEDGHTLSLFPGSPLIQEKEKWVAHVHKSPPDPDRITVLPAVVNRSSSIAFLVEGAKKANTLREVLSGAYRPELFPAQIIRPVWGELVWFVHPTPDC